MNIYELFFTCINIPYKQVGVSTNYQTLKKGDTLYIFFQGSNGVNDWKNNFDFPIKPYKRMGKTVWFAHGGFLRAFKEVEPYLQELLLDKSYSKLVIAGYSHGAAIASLCHEYIYFNRLDLRNNLLGFGFGCPRVFWGFKIKEIEKRWENFTVVRNINDLVTHLPPAILGYRHVGKMLEIGKQKKYTPVQAHYPENILKELKIYEKVIVIP